MSADTVAETTHDHTHAHDHAEDSGCGGGCACSHGGAPPAREAAPIAEATQVVTLTAKAADKVQSFLEDADDQAVALRVAVQAGGCAGFRYALFFDDRELDGDVIAEQHGVQIRIDKMSSPYIQGSVIDWKESLEASGFAIDNPNASNTCACGDSAGF